MFSQGYTIPLDKRLAADGRGLQQVHINENFAKLAEALYIADRKVSYVWKVLMIINIQQVLFSCLYSSGMTWLTSRGHNKFRVLVALCGSLMP